MKKTTVVLIVGLLIVGSISLYAVTAYAKRSAGMRSDAWGKQGYGYTQMLEIKTKIFDMTSEELQKELESGKTMLDIAKENGIILDQFHKKMLGAQKERLQNLVKTDVLTQEQADARIQIMEQRQEDCSGDCDCSENAGGMGRKMRSTGRLGRMGMRRAW